MRISTFISPLLFSTAITSLTACFVPRSIVQMDVGDTENFRWNYGRQVIHLKSDSIEADIFFDSHTKKYLIFDVEVTNWSNEEVLVSPEEIYLQQIENGANLHAFDPEVEIFGGKMKASRQEAAAKNIAVAVGVATVATVVAVAATSDGDNKKGIDYSNTSITYIGTDVTPPPPSVYYPPNIVFWEDYSLRKTTLAKGYKVGGKVVFPRLDYYPSLYVSIPVGGRVLTAHFKQKVYQP